MADVTVIMVRIARKPGHGALFDRTFGEDIREALDPNVIARRYGRSWRLSRPVELDDGFLAGKLGFTRNRDETEVQYDESVQDFVEHPTTTPNAIFAHWVLDLNSQLMAFETRPPDIKAGSFIGALSDILEANENYPFTVEPLTEEEAFFDWIAGVEKLIHFKAVMRPPNPHWGDRMSQLEGILEPTEADEATIDLKIDPERPEGLVVPGTIIEQAARHSEAGYGTVTADAVAGGERRRFVSKQKMRVRKIAEPIVDGTTALWQALMDLLRSSNDRSSSREPEGATSPVEEGR